MTDFPTLSENPSVEGWEEDLAFDPTIRSSFEGGYVQTRARTTRIPEKWKIKYEVLPTADKDILKVFQRDTVLVGSSSFNWTNPLDSVIYEVRIAEKFVFTPTGNTIDYWTCEAVFEEV